MSVHLTAMGIDTCHHIAYSLFAYSASTYLSSTARGSRTHSGGSCTTSWLVWRILLPWTGLEGHPSLIAVFQPTLPRTNLLHTHVRCCLYLKIRSRHQSVPCQTQGLWNWLRHCIPCSTTCALVASQTPGYSCLLSNFPSLKSNRDVVRIGIRVSRMESRQTASKPY